MLFPSQNQSNIMMSRRREHSRKPEKSYEIIEVCSPGLYLELFARIRRSGWIQWGNEIEIYPGNVREQNLLFTDDLIS